MNLLLSVSPHSWLLVSFPTMAFVSWCVRILKAQVKESTCGQNLNMVYHLGAIQPTPRTELGFPSSFVAVGPETNHKSLSSCWHVPRSSCALSAPCSLLQL